MTEINTIINSELCSDNLSSNIVNSNKIVAYGFGQGFLTFNEFVIKKCGLKLYSIIDQRFNNTKIINGIKATNLSSFEDSDLSKYIVVITIGNSATQEIIRSDLYKKGFQRVVSAFDFYEYHLSFASTEVIKGGNKYYQLHQRSISDAYASLQDDESKEVFRQILSLYVSRKIKKITSRKISEHYIPKDIPFKKGYADWINFGAYDGDAVRHVVNSFGPLNSLICIEPNLSSFGRLTEYLANENHTIAKEVLALPLACGYENNYTNFKPNGTNSSIASIHTSSKVSVHEPNSNPSSYDLSHVVLVAKLDQILIKKKISMINMDIEGAELSALKGLKNTITRQKPDLTISIYHEPAHLWQILLLIKSYNLDYQFFIRNYTGYPAETVLYACSSS